MAADAEFCMLVADSLEALGLARGDYIVKVNNRKVLNGMLELIGVPEGPEGDAHPAHRACARWTSSTGWVSKASASFWAAAARTNPAISPRAPDCPRKDIDRVLGFLHAKGDDRAAVCASMAELVKGSAIAEQGAAELAGNRCRADGGRFWSGSGALRSRRSSAASAITPARSSRPS